MPQSSNDVELIGNVMLYFTGGLGVIIFYALVSKLVVKNANRRGHVLVIKTPTTIKVISGVEFVFLFWFFNEKEQAVPLQLFLLSVVLAVLAFGIEHFFNQFQEEHLKAGRLYFTHDPNGRVIQITRDKYAADVLPENLKIVGDNPFDLGSFIVNAIEAGFAEECIQPAYRLRMIDPNLENSTLLLAHVLSLNNRLGEAQKVLEGYLKNVGVSVEVLFKLAWVYSQNGDLEKFEDASWRGLNLDPNHKHGYELLSS